MMHSGAKSLCSRLVWCDLAEASNIGFFVTSESARDPEESIPTWVMIGVLRYDTLLGPCVSFLLGRQQQRIVLLLRRYKTAIQGDESITSRCCAIDFDGSYEYFENARDASGSPAGIGTSKNRS